MHEGNFTERIVEAIQSALTEHRADKVLKVKVRVGEIYHLQKESVLMHYKILTQGTDLSQAVLDLIEEPVTIRCLDCPYEGPVPDHHFVYCPNCESFHTTIIGGDKILVEEIETTE